MDMVFCFRLQTRQWSERVIRRETREWKVHGNMTIRKDVQVRKKFAQVHKPSHSRY